MRTKTLLLTAVLGVAGAASTTVMGQSVYSQNAVGYVNLSIGPGFSIIANPLNNTTNNINSILTNGIPTGTQCFTYNTTLQSYSASSFLGGKWTPDQLLNPGSAMFINNKTANPIVVTFVGNVPQGSLTNVVPGGFSLQSLPIPVSVSLTNSIVGPLPAGTGDQAFNFSNSGQAYTGHSFLGGKFVPDYAPAVGEGFFYLAKAAGGFNWKVTFSVN